MVCGECSGSRDCDVCDGYGDSIDGIECSACIGSGTCPGCFGEGQISGRDNSAPLAGMEIGR